MFAALAAATAALTALAAAGGGTGPAGGRALALLAAGAVAAAAVAALAWAHYRGTRDPSALFLGVGFAALALQTGLFGVWWPLARGPWPVGVTLGTSVGIYSPLPDAFGSGRALVPVYGWQIGWLVAAALFLLSAPWWDRRGRAPVRPAVVIASTAALLIVADLALASWYGRAPDVGADVDVIALLAPDRHLAWWGWVAGVSAAAVLLAAAIRRWSRLSPRASRPWLTTAFLLGIPVQVAVLVHPRQGSPTARRADLLQFAVPALAFVGLLMDQRSEASRMRRATDRAEDVLDGRAEIASMIAHEVRGPVATVRGIAGTSITHYDRLTEGEHREFLGMIEQESRRLLTTVDQMSLALKIDAGSLRFDLKPQDLADILRAGVAAVEPREHHVSVDAAPGLTVSVDWARMVEVVRQIVDNAVKYSPPGTPILATIRREGGHAVIEITDRGPGIPAHERERLFEKFPDWRPPGYEAQPGTGLGLFICMGSVIEHRGAITIEDGPGGGTMLRVRLPVEG